MRLKLVHQLSLLLSGAALLAVLAVSMVVWWNLRTGFSDYLRIKDEAQLDRMTQILVRRATADPEFSWLRGSRDGMEALLTEFRGFERGRTRPDIIYSPNNAPPNAPQNPSIFSPNRPRHPPPPPPNAESIEGWIQIYNAKGEWLAGRPQGSSPSTVRVVELEGQAVAEIRLYRSTQPVGVDSQFLTRQYLGLGLSGVATLLISLLMGWLVSRRWARPLKALQQATKKVASGDLCVRTVPSGALEIAELMTDVNTMTASLDGLQKARRLWIAQISHELRTPLSVLRGELEAAQDGARTLNPTLLQSLLDEVLQLNRLVGDLHTLSMADLGQLHCEFMSQNAVPELWRIAMRYADLAQTQGLVLVVNPDKKVIPYIDVRWDMQRIGQVMTNVLSNSLRYTHSPGRILLQWQVVAATVLITLDDSAPSVPADAVDQLFEPLYRADAARRRDANYPVGGSGLGLAIAKAITLAHGGSITASHSALGGIKITLKLPQEPHER